MQKERLEMLNNRKVTRLGIEPRPSGKIPDALTTELSGLVEQQNLHKAVACHTLSLPLLFTEVLVLQVLRTNPSEVYLL